MLSSSTTVTIMFSSSSSPTTVGEALVEAGQPRGSLWARAILQPLFVLAMAMVMLYVVYSRSRTDDTVDHRIDNPWRLLVLLPWAPYLALGHVTVSYMDLFLPLAPLGVRNALIVQTGVGFFLLLVMSILVFLQGDARAVFALACVFAVALVDLLHSWLLVRRTYRASS